MSKYIIDIPNGVEWIIVTCRTKVGFLTRDFDFDSLEELNSDYINEHYSDLQDTAYQRGFDDAHRISEEEYHRGLEDAWEAAKKLFSSMADSDIEKAFPIEWNNGGFHALINLQPQEAIAKLKAYEVKQKADDEIKVGDEVEHCIQCFVVTAMNDEYVHGFSKDGTHCFASIKNVRKTGRHFDIASILEDMKE